MVLIYWITIIIYFILNILGSDSSISLLWVSIKRLVIYRAFSLPIFWSLYFREYSATLKKLSSCLVLIKGFHNFRESHLGYVVNFFWLFYPKYSLVMQMCLKDVSGHYNNRQMICVSISFQTLAVSVLWKMNLLLININLKSMLKHGTRLY